MRIQKSPRTEILSRTLPAILLAGFSVSICSQVWAQAAVPPMPEILSPSPNRIANQSRAHDTDHAPAALNMHDSPEARSNTPYEVLSGRATLVGHYDPASKLRLVL